MFNWLKRRAAAPDDGAMPKRQKVTGTRILKFADRGLLYAFIGAIIAVYILDAIFFMAWAPDAWLVPVFLLIGVTIRSVAVFAGPIMQVVSKDGTSKRDAGTIRALSVAAGLVCLIPALSFFAGGHYNQTHSGTVAAATETASDNNKAARIATLRGQVERIQTSRDAAVSEANRSIELIADDDVPGISPADNQNIALLRAEIQKYRTDADAQIAALENQVANIELEKETVQTEAAETKTKVSSAYAIFQVLGNIFGGAEIWAMSILFVFAMIIEAIAFFGLGAYQGLHKFFVEAIQRMELEEEAHEARLAAERSRQIAILEREIAEINLAAAESRARTQAMLDGQDGESFDAIRAAERNLKRAEANSLIAEILRKANATDPGDLTSFGAVNVATPTAGSTAEVASLAELNPEPLSLDEPATVQSARKGGRNSQQHRAAEKAARSRMLILADRRQDNVMKVAAE